MDIEYIIIFTMFFIIMLGIAIYKIFFSTRLETENTELYEEEYYNIIQQDDFDINDYYTKPEYCTIPGNIYYWSLYK